MLSKIKIVHIDKTSSTQDAVVEYLKNDYFPSLLLIAKIQTKGRGRKDDDWVSPEGDFGRLWVCRLHYILTIHN